MKKQTFISCAYQTWKRVHLRHVKCAFWNNTNDESWSELSHFIMHYWEWSQLDVFPVSLLPELPFSDILIIKVSGNMVFSYINISAWLAEARCYFGTLMHFIFIRGFCHYAKQRLLIPEVSISWHHYLLTVNKVTGVARLFVTETSDRE